MDAVCDAFEKTKNLILWEQKRMTSYFILIAFVLFLAVTFLPLRALIWLYLTHRFNRGRFFHKRRIRNNREVLLIEWNNFLEDNKWHGALTDKWETIAGKGRFKDLETKLYSHYQDSLKLYFPKNILLTCDSPSSLIDYVSTVKETLRLQETFRGKVSARNEQQLVNNPNVYRRSTPAYILLFNFIMNRVPSDLYRVRNPKLNLGSKDAERSLIESQETTPNLEPDMEEEDESD